jgi:hypothetical protein
MLITVMQFGGDVIWWRCDGEYAPVTFLVNCNDFFYCAADCEEVTEENLPIFKEIFEQCSAIDSADTRPITERHYASTYAPLLFTARIRKMFPMDYEYNRLSEELKILFYKAVKGEKLNEKTSVVHNFDFTPHFPGDSQPNSRSSWWNWWKQFR